MTAQENRLSLLGAQPSLPTERQVREFIRQRGLEVLGG
jgi:hypothetical protein